VIDTLGDLIKEYLSYITSDHHKRCDMFFSIEKAWDCGEFKGYRVVHQGYVNEDISEFFKTNADAEVYLINLLRGWIADEIEWRESEKNETE